MSATSLGLGFFMTTSAENFSLARPVVRECFACGRSHSGCEEKFCSARCRAWVDAGEPPYKPTVVTYSLPMTADGFLIRCAGCRQNFSSKGPRCCSPICEQNLRHQEDRLATMAEVGIEPSVKRKCEAPGCGRDIPRWTGIGKARREVRKDTRFCTARCKQKAARVAPSSQTAILSPIEAQKPLINMGSQ
jgi:hypothetical protein